MKKKKRKKKIPTLHFFRPLPETRNSFFAQTAAVGQEKYRRGIIMLISSFMDIDLWPCAIQHSPILAVEEFLVERKFMVI